MNILLILFLVVNLMKLFCCQSLSEDCITPAGENGQCINVKECQFVVSTLINAPKPLPQDTREMLISLGCGFEGFTPKVCCALMETDENMFDKMDVRFDTTSSPIVSNTPRTTNTRRVTSAPRVFSKRTDPAQPEYYSEAPTSVEGHANLGLIPPNCGTAAQEPTVNVVTNKTEIYEFSWMALLTYNTNSGTKFNCGGTVINDRYILTAAHCVTNLGKNTLIGVTVGDYDLTKESDCDDYDDVEGCATRHQELEIEEAIPHPEYVGLGDKAVTSQFQHDVALVRVASPIDLSQINVKTVCLPIAMRYREKRLNDKELLVTGWNIKDGLTASPYLLKVQLPYYPNDDCGQKLNSSIGDGIGFRQLCAGGMLGMNFCGVDSGGPLQGLETDGYRKYVQYGISSFGPKNCANSDMPQVYTRVSHYVKWILDTIQP